MIEHIIDSKVIENGKIKRVEVIDFVDRKTESESHWGLKISNEKGKKEYLLGIFFDNPIRNFNDSEKTNYAGKLIQLRYDIKKKYDLNKNDEREIYINELSYSKYGYTDKSETANFVEILDLVKDYFENTDLALLIDYIYYSVKQDKKTVERILRKISGLGIMIRRKYDYVKTDDWLKEMQKVREDFGRKQHEKDVPVNHKIGDMNVGKINKKVFIVHGHNERKKYAVALFVKELGLEPIILHEKSSKGMSIPEKLEHHSDAEFAIVILSGDDLGRMKKDTELNKRARQNVILELGYFWAKLGRNRVHALYSKNVEIPSDYLGIVYTHFDKPGAWKQAIFKELKEIWPDINFPA